MMACTRHTANRPVKGSLQKRKGVAAHLMRAKGNQLEHDINRDMESVLIAHVLN